MKSAIICNFIGKKGAAPVFAYEMIKGLINNGKFVIAIIPDNIENLELWEKLPECKLILTRGYSDNKLDFGVSLVRLLLLERYKIRKICSAYNIEFIYIPMIQPLSQVVNNIFPEIKKVVTVHDPIPHKGMSAILIKIYDKVIFSADKIIILSNVFKEYVSKQYKFSIHDINVIPHGIFDNYKTVYDPSLKYEYDKSKINFLFFGRITPYKGLDTLAKSYKRLYEKYPDVALTVVGNGNFKPYKELYSHLKNVTIINRWIKDEEVYGYFYNSDVTVVLPYSEATQSGVIPVAMACESLVICSDCGGLIEQVEDKKTGIVVKTNDADELYKAMEHVVLQGTDKNIVANAKEYIETFSWDRLAKKLINVSL